MNEKATKSYLTKRHNEWLKSIDDTELRRVVSRNSLIAGGAIASLLLGETPNDLDIYLTDKETALRLAVYYVKKWNLDERHHKKVAIRVNLERKELRDMMRDEDVVSWYESTKRDNKESSSVQYAHSCGGYGTVYDEHILDSITIADLYRENAYSNGISIYIVSSGVVTEDDGVPKKATSTDSESEKQENELQEKELFRPVFMTDNAISLSGDVQVILRFNGSAEQITENFDYAHCLCTYTPCSKELRLPERALVSLLTKELKYVGSRYPICSLFRMRKFLQRGYHINAGQILKMVFQIKDLDLDDPAVLRDQLIGVDSLYMSMLVASIDRAIKDKKEITTGYLLELIDELF